MDLTPEERDELLAAWALDALDREDTRRIERVLAADPELAAQGQELRNVVALLGESVAVTPPPELRSDLLDRAASTGPATIEPTDPLSLLETQIEALHEVLVQLDDEGWTRPVDPYPWSVHGLVAHLLVIERYTRVQLGLDPPGRTEGPTGHLELGVDEIEARQAGSPIDTRTAWRDAATATVAALRAGHGPSPDGTVDFHGFALTVGNLAIVRAFEIWTHADDIRRAVERQVVDPAPADLRAMSRLSVRSLPVVLPLVAPEADFGGARVVLTGAGGGTFDLGEATNRDVLVVADVIDYCRFAARRMSREQLAPVIEGDRETADHLFAAARVLAI